MKKIQLWIVIICLLTANFSYATSLTSDSDYEKVVDNIISNLANNEENFQISCEGQAYSDIQHILFDKNMQGVDSQKNLVFWSLVFDEIPEYTRYSILNFYENYHVGSNSMLMDMHVIYSHSYEEKEWIYTQARKLIDSEFKMLTDYEKIMKIHNLLINRVAYDDDIESLYAFSPLPFFNQEINSGQMVCQGYAIVVDLLCQMISLDAEIVEGRLAGVDHLWNKVKIGDNWFHFDVTSDDQLSSREISYRYFGLSDQEIKKTHQFVEEEPMCEKNLEQERIK